MNIINGSEKMKVSAEKPATTHTRDRYLDIINLELVPKFAN